MNEEGLMTYVAAYPQRALELFSPLYTDYGFYGVIGLLFQLLY